MIKHINNLLENNNVLMGNIVRCFKDGSSSLCTWLSTLEGFPGSSVQFSHSSCPTFCNPMNHTACQASLSVTNSQSLPKPMSIQSTMPSNHLILCRPLLLPGRAAGKESESCSWCLTLCDPMDDIVHGILQAKTLEWVAFPFSCTSAQPRNQTRVSCIAGGFSCFAAGKEADFALYQVLSTLALDILGNTFLWGLSYAL